MESKAPLVILGTLFGLASGVLIGFLTAPCNGQKTREKVGKQAENLRKVIMGFRSRHSHNVDDGRHLLNETLPGQMPQA